MWCTVLKGVDYGSKKKAGLEYDGLSRSQRDAVGRNVLSLFPAAAARS